MKISRIRGYKLYLQLCEIEQGRNMYQNSKPKSHRGSVRHVSFPFVWLPPWIQTTASTQVSRCTDTSVQSWRDCIFDSHGLLYPQSYFSILSGSLVTKSDVDVGIDRELNNDIRAQQTNMICVMGFSRYICTSTIVNQLQSLVERNTRVEDYNRLIANNTMLRSYQSK